MTKVIDTIGVTYDSMEELLERQTYIEKQLQGFIDTKRIADRFESTVVVTKNNKYNLEIKLLSDSE